MQYKNKTQIEDEINKWTSHQEIRKAIYDLVHQIRQNDLNVVKEMIEEGIKITRPIPCPDGQPRCLVYHCETIRRDLTKDELLQNLDNLNK